VRQMSKETPKDDPREKTDWKPYPATDEPWKQNAQKATRLSRI
jgi:hypothetical protein